MDNKVIHYKVYLSHYDKVLEIRHLVIDKIVCHNYQFLIQKILQLFPHLKYDTIILYWKDKEGDNVKIGTDEELMIALNEMDCESFKKIYVKPGNEDPLLHKNVECDECGHPIQGFRYKCLVCPEFDICADCERSKMHPDHSVIRIPKPLTNDMPFGKRFAKDLRIINEQMESLFHQAAGNGDQMDDNKTSYFENKEQYKNLCSYNENHQLSKYMISEKQYKRMEWKTANYVRQLAEKDQQNVLTEGLNSLHIHNTEDELDENLSRLNQISLQIQKLFLQEEKQRALDDPENGTVANSIPSNIELPQSSDLSSESDCAPDPASVEPDVFQMDDAPVFADPTPVLQALHSPPLSALDAIPVLDSPSAPVDDSSSDEADPSEPPSKKYITLIPISQLLDPISSPFSVPSTEKVQQDYDILSYSRPGVANLWNAACKDPIEETMMRLRLLGFEDQDWLRIIVEDKKGSLKEVLRFLSPISTCPYANNFD